MGLRLADRWVWDFWLAECDNEKHIFYLQAPRSLLDPGLRHHRATIGHAVSSDFEQWHVLPDALGPGDPGEWDDLATWTGSVLNHAGKWWMLYTGVSRADRGRAQRIGLATSDDLVQWEKHPANPVLTADRRWYQVSEGTEGADEPWRDPWLFVSRQDGMVHALVTARAPGVDPDSAGVLGHARSADLVAWEVLPPLVAPAEFAQMEVPQLLGSPEGPVAVLFSCLAGDHSRRRRRRLGDQACSGTYAMCAPELDGSYAVSDSPIGARAGLGSLYAGKVVTNTEGREAFMAFRGGYDAEFTGEIMGPFAGPDFAVPRLGS